MAPVFDAGSTEVTPGAAAADLRRASAVDIERAPSHDDERVVQVMASVYAGNTRARHDWLYRDNPHGRGVTWLALERSTGALLGGTSMFPRRVLVDGRERLGAVGGDCYVLPTARRRGIATTLHASSLADMGRAGLGFMYGPPVVENLRALLRAGSTGVARFRRWTRPLTGSAVYRAVRRDGTSALGARLAGLPIAVLDRWHDGEAAGLTLEAVREFGEEFDTLFERAAPSHRIVCVRDRGYLAWRYRAWPAASEVAFAVRRRSDLIGFISVELGDGEVEVIDFFSSAVPATIDAMLAALLAHARLARWSTIVVNVIDGSPVARRLLRFGFVPRPGRLFQVGTRQGDPERETLTQRAAWHFMEADTPRHARAPEGGPANPDMT
jgi:GNAT acetyltransferase-like protein